MTPVHLCRLFHVGIFGTEFGKTFHGVVSNFGMSQFPAAETDGNLDFIALVQEADGVAALGFKIMRVYVERKTNLFHLHHFLIFLSFLVPLRLLKPIFAVIHELADRRRSVGSNFYQV